MRIISLILLLAFALVPINAVSQATHNTKVGTLQGGSVFFVKTDGEIQYNGADLDHSAELFLTDISGINTTAVIIPRAGTIASIVCTIPAVIGGGSNTSVQVYINGVAITNGACSIDEAAAAFSKVTVTPTALNTVAIGDIVSMESDGVAANAVGVHTVVIIDM